MPLLHEQMRCQLKPNGLFVHNAIGTDATANPRVRELATATPENNSAVTMIITDMLLQSHNGTIRLFPGMANKASARFGDLRAQGAFLVSSEIVDGDVSFVGIRSEVGGIARVLNPWPGRKVSIQRETGTVEELSGHELPIPMKPGKAVTLYCDGVPRPRRISSVRPASVKVMSIKGETIVLGKRSNSE